jgi:hypothetical protein
VQPVPEAKHLDIILYSREQLLQEYAAMPSKTGGDAVDPEQLLPDVPWGIISIKVRGFLLVGGCKSTAVSCQTSSVLAVAAVHMQCRRRSNC